MADTEYQTLVLDSTQFQSGAQQAQQAAQQTDRSIDELKKRTGELLRAFKDLKAAQGEGAIDDAAYQAAKAKLGAELSQVRRELAAASAATKTHATASTQAATAQDQLGQKAAKAGKDVEDAGNKSEKAAKKAGNWSQVGQGLSWAFQDIGQAGGDWTQKLGAGVNNIDQIVGNLPAKFAGLATPLTAIATVTLMVVQNWEAISSLWSGPRSKIPDAVEDLEGLEDRLRTVNKELDDFREKSDLKGLTAGEMQKYNELLERRVELEGSVNQKKKERQDIEHLESIRGKEAVERAEAIDKAIEAAGGWEKVQEQLARRSVANSATPWEQMTPQDQADARKWVTQLVTQARDSGGSSLEAIQRLGARGGTFGDQLNFELTKKDREAAKKAFEEEQKQQEEHAQKMRKDQEDAQKKAQQAAEREAERVAGARGERFLRDLLENQARAPGDPRRRTAQEFGIAQTEDIRRDLLATGVAQTEEQARQLGDLIVRKLWERATQTIQERSIAENVGPDEAARKMLDEQRKKQAQESGEAERNRKAAQRVGSENEEIVKRTLDYLGPQIQAALAQGRAAGMAPDALERDVAGQVEEFLRRAGPRADPANRGIYSDPMRAGGIAYDVVGRAQEQLGQQVQGGMAETVQFQQYAVTAAEATANQLAQMRQQLRENNQRMRAVMQQTIQQGRTAQKRGNGGG